MDHKCQHTTQIHTKQVNTQCYTYSTVVSTNVVSHNVEVTDPSIVPAMDQYNKYRRCKAMG